MGFGDKLKDLREQAQQAVSDNKEKIQGAVQTAGEVANTRTKGKYASTIAKVGEKVTTGVDKFASEDEEHTATEPAAHEPPMHVESEVTDPPVTTPATPTGAPPEFE
jgi:gas vesicle protein